MASVAGLKTLEILNREGAYETIINHGKRLMAAASKSLDARGISHRIVGDPVLFDMFSPMKMSSIIELSEATVKAGLFNASSGHLVSSNQPLKCIHIWP